MSRLIDADALIMAIPDTSADIFENCRNCKLLDKERITDIINNAPTIEAERHGIWIGEGDGYADGEFVYDTWYCSNCDYVVEDDCEPDFKYCPHCGAKMDEVEEDEYID